MFLQNASELTDHLPADMPYHVLFDENCDGDTEYCDKVLQWLPELMRRLSGVGAGGEFTWVKGAGHDRVQPPRRGLGRGRRRVRKGDRTLARGTPIRGLSQSTFANTRACGRVLTCAPESRRLNPCVGSMPAASTSSSKPKGEPRDDLQLTPRG